MEKKRPWSLGDGRRYPPLVPLLPKRFAFCYDYVVISRISKQYESMLEDDTWYKHLTRYLRS